LWSWQIRQKVWKFIKLLRWKIFCKHILFYFDYDKLICNAEKNIYIYQAWVKEISIAWSPMRILNKG
jgi:hypothetical protein